MWRHQLLEWSGCGHALCCAGLLFCRGLSGGCQHFWCRLLSPALLAGADRLFLFLGLYRPLWEWVEEGERVGPWQHDRLEKRGSSRRRDSTAWQNALGEHIGHKKGVSLSQLDVLLNTWTLPK